MGWPNNPRPAKSLVKLREQINSLYPSRNKASDGMIGDTAHAYQGSDSDHNGWVTDANGVGVVTAFDITHDPSQGLDIAELAQRLADSHDSRIKYMIRNGQILFPSNWVWQAYNGSDPHTSHLHLSVKSDQANYDNETPWSVQGEPMATVVDEPILALLTSSILNRQPVAGDNGYLGRNVIEVATEFYNSGEHKSIIETYDKAKSLQAKVNELQGGKEDAKSANLKKALKDFLS